MSVRAFKACFGGGTEAMAESIGDECPQCHRRVMVTARGNLWDHKPVSGSACGRAGCNGLCVQSGVTYLGAEFVAAARAFVARLKIRQAAGSPPAP